MYFRWTILLWLDTWHAGVSSTTSRPLGFVRECEPKTRSLCTEQKEFFHIIRTSYFLNLLLRFIALNLLLRFIALNLTNTKHTLRFRGSCRSSRFAVFWDMTPCELTYQHLRLNVRPQFFRAKDGFVLKKEAVGCYKIVVSIYQFARRHIPQCREIDNTVYLSNICCNITIPCTRYTYGETRLWWPTMVPFKSAQLIPVVNLWKPLNIM